ncbi:MAG: AMP-binding protein [Terracidiphilus sp.]|nr:AMP-binding protein [Terracidiphilus sp.]
MYDNLATLLNDFRRYDRQTAVVRYQGNRRRVTTYSELAQLAGRLAALLAQRGIGPGDRVLLWAENSAEWIAAFHGCMLRGVLVVPLDASGSVDFASRVAADTSPRLAVGDELLLGQLAGEWPQLTFEDWLNVLPAEEAGPVAGLSAATPLQILFTSGTTADPKGVVLTHGNVLASIGPIENGAQPYMRYEKLIHPLRILHTLPLSHVFGQTMGLWVPPIFAAELHFDNRPVASRLIETIRRERISVLAAVPRVLALLKTHLESVYPGLADRAAASSRLGALRRWIRFRRIHAAFGLKFWALISGGGALPGPLEQFWNALGFVLIQGYGMTETTALITLNHPFHVARGTIGKPMPGREVKLGPDGEVMVRGASIAAATWSGGILHPRQNEWLATGDLAQTEPSGELRFLGRKSEVIVTSSGLNLHPEDLEAAIEQEPGVVACAVLGVETASGPEPFGVLAFRGPEEQAAVAIEHANARLAPYQRLRRWALWPEPDLPRTSTGKVRRMAVEAWLDQLYSATATAGTGAAHPVDMGAFGASADWLLALIAQISGETQHGIGDELRLTEDLHLDSLGRVQLAAAIEERLGITTENGLLDQVQTLGELRRLLTAEPEAEMYPGNGQAVDRARSVATAATAAPAQPEPSSPGRHIYPRWPWLKPFHWLRAAFTEAFMRPLVWLLANPRVVAPPDLNPAAPMLIVANHVTAYDVPFLEYALPGPIRRRMAVAMSGEMLQAYRCFHNPEPLHPSGRFFLPGPLYYLLMTALFNVFPLPRRRDFQPSFAHAGEALDHGFNVLVFPEGSRSAAGELAQFRPGIGLLARQSGAAVLPMAIRGLGKLKASRGRWFRSGAIEVVIGQPLRFSPAETEAAITARLHAEVEKLLKG